MASLPRRRCAAIGPYQSSGEASHVNEQNHFPRSRSLCCVPEQGTARSGLTFISSRKTTHRSAPSMSTKTSSTVPTGMIRSCETSRHAPCHRPPGTTEAVPWAGSAQCQLRRSMAWRCRSIDRCRKTAKTMLFMPICLAKTQALIIGSGSPECRVPRGLTFFGSESWRWPMLEVIIASMSSKPGFSMCWRRSCQVPDPLRAHPTPCGVCSPLHRRPDRKPHLVEITTTNPGAVRRRSC